MKLKNGQSLKISVNVVPVISGNIRRNTLEPSLQDSSRELVKTLDLADTLPTKTESSAIDMLIGNDYYLDIVHSQKMEVSEGLYLLNSKLGWILSGRKESASESAEEENLLILTFGSHLDNTNVFQTVDNSVQSKVDLEDFWNIESIGVKSESEEVIDDEIVMKKFKDEVVFEDGRYQVTWPWKEEECDLPSKRQLAIGRLKSCLKKLRNKPELLNKYNSIIQDQLAKGIIEKVSEHGISERHHYIPHHGVVTPNKSTTKLRIVYDASAKVSNESKSLNECLYRGPVMLQDLCGLLMRFRLHKIALVSDIEKAFLQIGLQPSERDVTRFFWVNDTQDSSFGYDNLDVYRFCRVPFGIVSSPFLLGATVETHLESYGTPIAEQLKRDIYVDNIITGANSAQESIEIYQKAKYMFNEASMNLREWLSYSDLVNESIPSHDRAELKETQVLGHTWNHKTDTLSLKDIKEKDEKQKITKRNVLKTVASVFDPMGLFSPVLLRGKLLLQEMWKRGNDWDEEIVDIVIQNQWAELKKDFENISNYKIGRNISVDDKAIKYRLLCFCDASKRSYSAAVYLHQESDNSSKLDLVFAKTRLAPVKEMTIPRLELMAVLIGVKYLQFVKDQLKLDILEEFLWSDSQVAIAWIKSNKSLPVFVKNRVEEIRKHEHVDIRYINTKENPADVATRGSNAKDLSENELWWKGPTKFSENSETWKFDYGLGVYLLSNEEQRSSQSCILQEVSVTSVNAIEPPFGTDIERYSSLGKLLRVTALVLSFIRKLRRVQCKSKQITCENILEAENMWIRYIQRKHYHKDYSAILTNKSTQLQNQLGLYIDDNRMIRCRGRLDNSDLVESARRPLLLPHDEHFTKLVIEKNHKECLHSGVSQTLAKTRQKFWITHGRSAVKKTLTSCKVCTRFEGGPYRMPPMPDLPNSRVNEFPAFSKTGLDYLGPLQIKTSDGIWKKVWICLFTCMTTRAIHLEVIQDMTSEEFLLGFRRFVSQCGVPSEVLSDNAAQFKLSKQVVEDVWKNVIQSEDIHSYVSTSGIKWKFIVELAPWMGGFYERLVGVVKRSMRKSIGRKLLTMIQLQTLIKEVESTVNSRPLVYVEDDVNSNIPLSPNHFLTLNPTTGIPDLDSEYQDEDYNPSESSKNKLLKIWKKGQKTLNEFWRIWREEYLTSLRERNQTQLKAGKVLYKSNPSVGDVVQIKDNVARGSWKIGRIINLVKSRDGSVRSAKVELPSKTVIGRPLNLLYPLECSGSSDKLKGNKDIIPDKKGDVIQRQTSQRQSAKKATRQIRKLFDNESLKLKLHQNLYGQHLVIGPVVSHLRGHFEGPSNKALVLSFHGTTGTGKNFVSKFITDALYARGVRSKFVHLISATRDFPHSSMINTYKDRLKHKIESAVKQCPKSLFIIDEMDKLLPGLIDIIKPYIDFYDHLNGVDYRKTIFIFLSNTAGTKITETVLEKYELGVEREKITLKEMEDIIRTTVYREGKGLWNISLVKNSLITAFIPFLPLEKKHVKQCIVAGLFRKGYYKSEYQIDMDMVNVIADELMYFPNSTKLFSTTGCKRVFEKIDLVLQEY